jgi:phage replication-related protein YjqB (UPF0714/DUF867 family)
MAAMTLRIRVRRAPADSELTDHPEHCWVDARLMAALDRTGHPQVRIRRGDEFALYTVSGVVDEDDADVVRMGRPGRARIDGPDAFDADVDPLVTRSTLDDTRAADQGELVERLTGDRQQRELIAIAPHGGEIEHDTDEQAQRVATSLGGCGWVCKGWRPHGGAGERWHITATDIDVASFPLLQPVARRRFRHAVAFHGFAGSGVLIGGRASDEIKHAVCGAIEEALPAGVVVRIAPADDRLGGNDPANLVNRLTVGRRHGLQIEQDDDVRELHWREVADAVSSVYAPLLQTGGVPHSGNL